MTDTAKKSVLVIGGGAVGAIAALNLDVGGLAEVTIVLRSNYKVVNESGYNFESCDHGTVKGWKPSVGTSPPPSPSKVSKVLHQTKHVTFNTTPSPLHHPQPRPRIPPTLRLHSPLHQKHA
jgi:hypothetical protein